MNSKKFLTFMLLISIFSFSTFASDFNVNDIMGIITGTNAKIPATFDIKNIEAGPRDYQVTVEFDGAGQKVMYAAFAKLKKT